jgi:hypothetical protein
LGLKINHLATLPATNGRKKTAKKTRNGAKQKKLVVG